MVQADLYWTRMMFSDSYVEDISSVCMCVSVCPPLLHDRNMF